jgi:ribosome-associated toxin RatA of RatAB toxin-antitoxin module
MHIHREKFLHYTQEQVFSVINDIPSYQDYLPWCSKSAVLWKKEHFLEGLLEIKFGFLRYQFSTINEVFHHDKIKMKLSSGPFKHLKGEWSIHSKDDQSSVLIFDIDFEFNSVLLSRTFGVFFEKICQNIIDSFEKRLYQLYSL